jgi:predicted amidohydrolase
MLALLAQLTPEPGAPAVNAARAAAAIRAHPEAEIAAFPELFLSGYRLEDLGPVAVGADSPELRDVAAACAEVGTAALVGFVEADRRDFRNAVACIDRDGEHVATYRKAQLFGAEADAFRRGEWLLVVELAGRAVAPLICFDVEFPELARAAALAGADLLVTVAANMQPFGREHQIHTTARALENRIPHLYVNRGGGESGFEFVGESRAVAADGSITVEAAGAGEELLVAEVGPPGAADSRVDYLAFEPSRLPVEVHDKSHSQGGLG